MNEHALAEMLIPPTDNPALDQALADKLATIKARGGSFGMLESLAMLLGAIQNSLTPQIGTASLVLVAADHGLAAADRGLAPSTAETIAALRAGRLPLAALARTHDARLEIVHASGREAAPGGTDALAGLVSTTADSRRGAAMTAAQAHAALRRGMRDSERAQGGAVVCVGFGVGSGAGAAAVLGALTQRDPAQFLGAGSPWRASVQAAREQHRALWQPGAGRDPIDVVAALGGFELATLVGLMLGAAARRQLLLVDGIAAFAAAKVAMQIAPYVADYCIPVRSHSGADLGAALALWRQPALPLPFDLETTDGSAGVLALPLLRSAASLLATVVR